MKENVVKWGMRNTIVTCNESDAFSKMTSQFDCVVVDAPCSGEGMFRKDINARDEWSESNVQLCSVRQRDILQNIIPSIKSGGYLVYSTCTFAPDENERNCEWLVKEHDLESVHVSIEASWNINRVTGSNFDAMQFLPHRVSGEGFYIAVFKKKGFDHSQSNRSKLIFENCSRKEMDLLSKWTVKDLQFVKAPDNHFYASDFSANELNEIAKSLYITLPGVELGSIIRDEFIPAHALALSGLGSATIADFQLTLEEALSYLRGDSLSGGELAGWHIARFNDQALGWIKVLKNRSNNYYPKEWRIRMR